MPACVMQFWAVLTSDMHASTCRAEEFSIKMVLSDDESTVDIMVQGDDEEIERMRKEFNFMEKDMIYVPGLLESMSKKE